METLQEFRDAMDASPLSLKERVEQHFERAHFHFPSLERNERFLINNAHAFLGVRELAVAKAFSCSASSAIRSRLYPLGAFCIRAAGRGFDLIIFAGNPFEVLDYLKFRGPLGYLRHTHATRAWRPDDLASNFEVIILPGAEAYVKANEWCLKMFA